MRTLRDQRGACIIYPMSKRHLIGSTLLGVFVVGAGCTCEDQPIDLPPPALPRLPPPLQRALEIKAKRVVVAPPATPELRARRVYARLLAALAGPDDAALLSLLAPALRRKHGDKALLTTLRAHAKRHGADALDRWVAETRVQAQAGGKLRIDAGHTTCVLAPSPRGAVTPAPGSAPAASAAAGAAAAAGASKEPLPLVVQFLGVRSDLRFETYTVLLVSDEGLLARAGKLRRRKPPGRELLRVGGSAAP